MIAGLSELLVRGSTDFWSDSLIWACLILSNLKACRIIWRYSKNSIIYKRRSNLGCLSRGSKCKNQESVNARGSDCNSNRTFLLSYRRFATDLWRKWQKSAFYSGSFLLCPGSSILYHVIWVSLVRGRSIFDRPRLMVWWSLIILFRWNVIQMQTLMFVSFAFYSATNIVFADVKDGKTNTDSDSNVW